MKRTLRAICIGAIIGLASICMGVKAEAAPIAVSNYDVFNTQNSGFGGWSHYYTGTITVNGNGTVNETGGSGTLNDGIIGSSESNTHLFLNSDGTSFDIFLGQSAYVNTISLYSFFNANYIPGNIVSLNVTINGQTINIGTTGFGPIGLSGYPVHELINLYGSGLEMLQTNKITLSNFISTGAWANYSSISEVTVDGTPNQGPAPTPEPSTMILLGTGIGGLALLRKRLRRS